MDKIKELKNSIDILEVTLDNLLVKHKDLKAELGKRDQVVAELKSENDALTKAVKELAVKIGTAEKKEGQKDD